MTLTDDAPPFRAKALAERLGIPEATLRGWRHQDTHRPPGEPRKGPRFYKLGEIVMYDQADVAEWIEEQKALTAP